MARSKKAGSLATLTESVHRFWPLFAFEGAAMILLGFAALVLPYLIVLSIPVAMGFLLSSAGLFTLVSTLSSSWRPGFGWSLASSLLTLAFGFLFFVWPFGGVTSLAAALGGFLAADGVLAIGMAAEHRRHMTAKWFTLYVSGVVSLACAAFLIWWMSRVELWMLDTVIALDFLANGIALSIIAFDAREMSD